VERSEMSGHYLFQESRKIASAGVPRGGLQPPHMEESLVSETGDLE
jgi:hypothetical protein